VPGEGVLVRASEWLRCSSATDGAESIAICLSAFSPGTVHRD
jgi:hypothetical protein